MSDSDYYRITRSSNDDDLYTTEEIYHRTQQS